MSTQTIPTNILTHNATANGETTLGAVDLDFDDLFDFTPPSIQSNIDPRTESLPKDSDFLQKQPSTTIDIDDIFATPDLDNLGLTYSKNLAKTDGLNAEPTPQPSVTVNPAPMKVTPTLIATAKVTTDNPAKNITAIDSQHKISSDFTEQSKVTIQPVTANVTQTHNDTIQASNHAILQTSSPTSKAQIKEKATHKQKKIKLSGKAKAHYIDTKPTVGKRCLHMMLVGAIFALVGLLVDWVINLSKAFGESNSAEMVWFFLPCLAVLGVVLGWFFGAKALDVVFGMFNITLDEKHPNDDDGFSSGLLKAIGFGLSIAIVGWLILMMLA